MTIHLTLERTNELLDAAVAEKGADYIYTDTRGFRAAPGSDGADCQYVHGNRPGCLVGNVLHRAGVELERLLQVEGFGVGDVDFQEYLDVTCDEGVLDLLSEAQQRQDGGDTWGDSVAYARGVAGDAQEDFE